MKKNAYFLNTLLAVVLGVGLLACVLLRAFAPALIMPKLNIPNLVLISLVTLVLEHYLAPGAKRCYICIPLLSALAFGLLPYAAAFAAPLGALRLAVSGGIVFTVTTFLFSSIQERLSSGPAAKAAPFISALGLYLAAQCLTGIFL